VANAPYVLIKENGKIEEGVTDAQGRTTVHKSPTPQRCIAHLVD
jgi:uncharacterized protein (DUF2345 family)